MRLNPFHTIQGKFTLYLSLLIIVMMSGFASWMIAREKKLLENAIVREGKALVESFAVACTNTMLYEAVGLVEEKGLLDHYISDLMQRKDFPIVYAMILDTDGQVIAHNKFKETGQVYRDEITKRSLLSWDTLIQYASPVHLDISTPLAISTKRWGTLRIGISLTNLKKDISSLIAKSIFYIAGFMLLSISIIGVLFGFVTRPLKSLTGKMDILPVQNDIFPPKSGRRDEIGILQDSFYRMLKRIRDDEKERERTQKNLLLTEKMVAIGKLTAGVAHEINNPLGGLLNCLYNFKKGAPSQEKQREYLDLMEDGIKRIQKVVINLLEYARSPRPERSDIDIAFLVDRALSLLQYQIRHNHIRVEREIPADLPPVRVDASQMGQVLVNIFLNALQAMEDGGRMEIKAENSKGRLVLTISDSGKGIPEHVLPNIFDPFFTSKGEGQGTGLGLWVCQGIMERHGGKIKVTSREKEGTTVKIVLPANNPAVS